MNPGESSLRHVAVCEACGRCGSGQYDTPTEAKLAMLQHGHWAWATSGTGGVVCPICLTLGPKHKALSEGDVTSCGVRSACRCTPHPCRQSRLREPVIAKLVPWIHANCQHRKTLDTKNSSYAWKHRAEATERQEAFGWPRRELVRGIGEYVSKGPIRGLRFEEADDWRERWTTILEAMGYRVASPMRGKENLKGRGPIVNSYEEIPMSSARGIYGRDTFDVVMCEVTVANLLGATEASIGSAMEIQRGHDFNRYVLVVMDESGVHNHPFIKEAASLVVHSEEEAFEVLENLIKPYRTRLTLASEGADG